LRLYDSANRLLLLQVNFHIHLSYEFLIVMLLYILF
jgi:hypothetical protein